MNSFANRMRLQFQNAFWYILVSLALLVVLASVPAYLRQLGMNTLVERLQLSVLTMDYQPNGTLEYWLDLANMVIQIGSSAACLALSVLIYRSRPKEPIALFVSLFLILFGTIMTGPLQTIFLESKAGLQIVGRAEAVLFAGWAVLFFVFPDGQFYPPWTRLLAWVFLPWAVLTLVFRDFFSPMTRPETWQILLLFAWYMTWPVTTLVVQVLRFRQHSQPVARQQTKWVVLGFVTFISVMFAMILVLLIDYVTKGTTGFQTRLLFLVQGYGLIWYLLISFVPITMGIAILRFHLWDIDFILNRTLVYITLTALVLLIYIGIVEGIGMLLNSSGNVFLSIIATGLIAVLFQPLRQRMQGFVNQLMYGKRDDPYAVLVNLHQRLQNTLTPQAVLPMALETITTALRIPYAAIFVWQGETYQPAAEFGLRPAHWPGIFIPTTGPNEGPRIRDAGQHQEDMLVLPLVYQKTSIGNLILASRTRGEGFSAADRRILTDIANQVGVLTYTVQLNNDLQRSRERLVLLREEERRRLRRDLHDGLGTQLAGLSYNVNAIRNVVHQNPGQADALLDGVAEQLHTALADLRRLVYDLRPPALDQLGLVSAIREQIVRFPWPDGLQASLEAPDSLPNLPAAVEVAAYRVIMEGLTNVCRHAQAKNCQVRLQITPKGNLQPEMLQIEIFDDGSGLPEDYHSGVGLLSMQERTAELGGDFFIGTNPTGGTRLCISLPSRFPEQDGR